MKKIKVLELRKIVIINILVFSSAFISCRKYLTIDNPPIGQQTTSTVFKTDAGATSAVLTNYVFLRSLPALLSQRNGELADELTNYSLNPTGYYTNSMLPSSTTWREVGYYYIFICNQALDGIVNSNNLSPKVSRQLIAENKFIRAFCYWYLTNLWGDVPLVTTSDYKVINLLPRATKETVYQQMISDLKDAEANLNANYVDASDTISTSDRIRPNQAAASALLSRVYLYHKEWQNAINEANKVINNTNYKLLPALGDVFKANSGEAIWQIQADLTASRGTAEAQQFVLTGIPNGAMDALSSQLINAFEPNDKRMNNWVGVYTDTKSLTSYYYPAKYKALTGTPEYSTPLRLAEQYLIRAEAEVQLGDLTSATIDLNVIRSRAGLPNVSSSTKEGMLALIMKERQIELFSEGHRWFDLIRTDNINVVMSIVTPLKGGGQWQPFKALLPIPQADINVDPNLTQNPGY